MVTSLSDEARRKADREKRRVALTSLAAAVCLTGLKLAVGLWTNSLGILSEAAHSGLDLVAAGITLWAVRISSRPADRDHTYGHGKFENLSAFLETLLLLATCVWVVYEAVRRLLLGAAAEVDANVWAFAIIVLSMVVDYSRSRALLHVARKYHSQALEADALHFSTDIWSSGVVLIGLTGVLAAERYSLPWLMKADALAALGVAGIVIHLSLRMGLKSVDELLDRVPQELQSEVARAAEQVPGVREVKQVRIRRSGPEVFTDVTLTVDRAEAFEGAHDIADRAETAIRSVLPMADVVVHVEPVVGEDEALVKRVRLLAARHGLGAHAIRLYCRDGFRQLELHLEVDGSLRLEEAHHQATELEHAIHEAEPEIDSIVTHLEPWDDATALRASEPAGAGQIERLVADYAAAQAPTIRPHDIQVQLVDGEIAVSFHCMLDPNTTIVEAHTLTVDLEHYLRQRVRNLGRVLIHVEPPHDIPGG